MTASEAQTPSEQHQPPSLPNSPHPKRIRTTNPLDTPGTAPISLPTMSATQNGQDATPTPSTLPPVSSLLPGIPSDTGMPIPIPAPVAPLLIQKLSEDATAPTRGSAHAAGYDLYAAAPLTLKAKSKGLVSTGIAIAVPAGTYGRVAPRSGLASKHFLDTGAGVIDADYRGEVKVLLFNFSDVDYEVKTGERVAQLVLERIVTPDVVVVEKLEASVRGAGGFGSTGYI